MLDLLGQPIVPPEGYYRIRFVRWEHMHSQSRGLMTRLVAEVTRGPYAGAVVFKPLTPNLEGIGWLERSFERLGIKFPEAPLSRYFHALLERIIGTECIADTYNFKHRAGPFPTIRTVRST